MKTWLVAIFTVVRAILYPSTKICIASSTRPQANEVLSKIIDDFLKNYDWGSINLANEIKEYTINNNKGEIIFKNGSWIKVVTASDSGRGNRANIIIIDEFRMVEKDVIDTVLKKFLSSPRHPLYLDNPKYAHLEERNIEMYMSSAWYKSHWCYEKAKAFTVNSLRDNVNYFICGLPYQIAILEGLLSREQVEDEMSEIDFNEISFSIEMECLFFGDTDGAFFTFDDISDCRKLKSAVYPPTISNNLYVSNIPDLVENERRILSVDIALMASSKNKNNDASSIIINSAIPNNNNNYIANIIYMENHEGLNTDELALVVRQLYDWFKCTDMVLDCNGNGLGVFDAVIKDIVDPKTGEIYSALSCCNDEDMASRCKIDNAPKVIWSIKASEKFNSQACINLRGGFQKRKINLLISEQMVDEILKNKIKGYDKLVVGQKFMYRQPYIETTLLMYELISLESKVNGTNIKLTEKSGMRKDRYSSLAYNYWVQCQLEREELNKRKTGFNLNSFAEGMRKLNRKPNTY